MEVRTLPGVASALLSDLGRLTKTAVEFVHDPVLVGDSGLESSIEVLLDRLCLSIQLSKPVGLISWAEREGQRLGTFRATELAGAAAHAIANAADSYPIDHGRLLAFLEILKCGIDSALSSLDGSPQPEPRAYAESTEALLALLGERDSATCCHSRATGEWARRLSTAMGLSEETTAFVELCAVLHDIGKISTPDSILFKRSALTEEEWEVMREHAASGQRVLDRIPSLRRCAMVVRAHHERWDGTGYPDGLAATTIPFEARVVAVADAFHAMISDRPYRKAIPPRQALEILRAGAGTQWDPQVVAAMLGLFHRIGHAQPASRVSTA
ncbi:MAG TPA: HD-GYP domain-containing protein [Candidatus Baltobacteraceae bacterium]|jgi:HD-GYP domain-containing protein (c-di-GMP phosphodiesterase class II)